MKPAGLDKLTGLTSRFGAFVAERYPFALSDAIEAFDAVAGGRPSSSEQDIDALRVPFRRELTRRLHARPLPPGLADTTPRTSAETRVGQAYAELLEACDGF